MAVFFCAFSAAYAQTTFTWTGATNGDLGLAANWSPTAPVSSASDTRLVFGGNAGHFELTLPATIEVNSLTFASDTQYDLASLIANSSTLRLGAGGIEVNTGAEVDFSSDLPLELLAAQTWNIGGALSVAGTINGHFSLTKTGTGSLTLGGANTFDGGFTLAEGRLWLASSSTRDGSAVFSGPVGTGTLTLGDDTVLAPYFDAITLDNAITLGNGVTFGASGNDNSLKLTGDITPAQTDTEIRVEGHEPLYISGRLLDATAGATSLTFFSGISVLSGDNGYTSTTTANAAAVVFLTCPSISTTEIKITNGGYVGAGTNGDAEKILRLIVTPGDVAGSLGLDTDPSASTPTTFNDPLNFGSFSSTTFSGLSSLTKAVFAGTVTPVGGGNYKFGGYGSGQLYVGSALTEDGTAGLTIASDAASGSWLNVFLGGANSFVGNVLVKHATAVFDSPSALPDADTTITLAGTTPYAGFTDAAGETFADFVGRIRLDENEPVYDPVIGFDSHNVIERQFAPGTAVLPHAFSESIDLNLLGRSVYLGTATRAKLTGVIHDGDLYVAGVGSGWLTIASALTAANDIGLVKIGSGSAAQNTSAGVVQFDSATSDYASGTTLYTGYTVLGASSTAGANHTVVSGPLGTGLIEVLGTGAALVAGASDITLHNPIQLYSHSLQLGVAATSDPTDAAYQLAGFAANNLTLAGAITGDTGSDGHSQIDVYGSGTLTLTAANTFSALNLHGGMLVATDDHALAFTEVALLEGSTLNFTTAAPQVASLSQGWDGDIVNLAANSTLTIAGGDGAYFAGSIRDGGGGAKLVYSSGSSLSFSGASTYSGGTLIDSGVLYADNASAFGSGDVTIGGGRLYVNHGITLINAISFSGNDGYGGFLEGTGAFSGNVLVANDGVITPAYDGGVGQLSFTNTSTLTFGSGGNYHFDPGDPAEQSHPGVDYDNLDIKGSLLVTATFADPFHLIRGDFSAFDPSVAHSWQIATTTAAIPNFDAGKFAIGEFYSYYNVFNFAGSDDDGGLTLTTSPNGKNLLLNYTPASVWSGGHGDLFTTAANWASGAMPASGTDAWIRFNNAGSDGHNEILLPGTYDAAKFAFGLSGAHDDGSEFLIGSAEVNGTTLTLRHGLFSGVEDHDGGGVHVTFDAKVSLVLANSQWLQLTDGTVDLRGAVSETGGSRALGIAGGVLRLAGNNTFTGGVVVGENDGLAIASDTALGTGTLTLFNNAFVAPEGTRTIANAVTFRGDDVAFKNSSFDRTGAVASLTIGGLATLTQSLTINSSLDGDLRLTGGVAESGSSPAALNYWGTGTGKLVLTGASSYTGGTHAAQGAVIFGTAAALPATGAITADSGGYVGLADPTATAAFLGRIDAAHFQGTLGFDSLGQTTNTFTNLDLSALQNLGQVGSQTVATIAGTFTPIGNIYAFGGGSGTLTVTSTLEDTINGGGGHDTGVHHAFSFNAETPHASINPTVTRALTLDGGLTLVLTGDNTYSGGTLINSGHLIANNSDALGTASVTLAGGRLSVGNGVTLPNPIVFGGSQNAFLGGNGTFGSAITLANGGGIAPGNSVGHLTFAAGLTWSGNGAYEVEVQDANLGAGVGYDTASVTGTLTFNAAIGSPFTIYLKSLTGSGAAGNIANFVATSFYSWTIADATTLSGFGTVNADNLVLDTSAFTNSFDGTFSLSTAGNSVLLNYTPAAVPEPSTWALLLTGLAAIAWSARRRARR